MNTSCTAAKSTARTALKGNWPAAIGVFAVFAAALAVKALLAEVLAMMFPVTAFPDVPIRGIAALATAVIELFGFAPLYLGVLRWFWRVTAGTADSVIGVFRYYNSAKDYRRSVGTVFGLFWRFALIFIACMLPYCALTALSSQLSADSPLIAFSAIVLAILGIVAAIIFMLKYYLVIPVVFSDDNVSVSDAFRVSRIISRGNKAMLVYMLLGFMGWILLCLFAVPMLFAVPYIVASVMVFSRYSINNYIMKAKYTAPASENPAV